LSCIPCLGSAPQYILCAYSVHSFPVCITSTSILASLRCTCFVIARQILSTPCRHSGQTPHRPSRTLRPTDRNNWASNLLILGFSAASGMSAEHFCLCFHASASRSHASASHSCALALLSHMFRQFSLTSALAIHKISDCLSLAPGRTSKNHSEASRTMQQQVTCGLAKQ
jgi:hypothetical protein